MLQLLVQPLILTGRMNELHHDLWVSSTFGMRQGKWIPLTFLEMGTRDGSVDSLTGDANRNMDKERKDAWFHPSGEGRGMLGFLFKDWI